jgi:hypothetical protein
MVHPPTIVLSVPLTRAFRAIFRFDARDRTLQHIRDLLSAAGFRDRKRCPQRRGRAARSLPLAGFWNNDAKCGAFAPVAEIAVWRWPVPFAATELRGVCS